MNLIKFCKALQGCFITRITIGYELEGDDRVKDTVIKIEYVGQDFGQIRYLELKYEGECPTSELHLDLIRKFK